MPAPFSPSSSKGALEASSGLGGSIRGRDRWASSAGRRTYNHIRADPGKRTQLHHIHSSSIINNVNVS